MANNNLQGKQSAVGAGRPGSPADPGQFNSKSLLALLRPQQWIKNLLVFAGPIFSLAILQAEHFFTAVLAFASFCLWSSCAYIINDMRDAGEDRLHPRKRQRPLASNRVSVKQALVLLVILFAAAFLLSRQVSWGFLGIGLTYLAVAVSYTMWLRQIVILDLFAISGGFIIRALAGALAVGVDTSPWFLICTLLLSLFLALTKRRQELIWAEDCGGYRRRVLEHYPLAYLDQLISIVTASTIIAYSLYTFTAGQSELFMVTIPFVVYGIFRYLYLIYKRKVEENPDDVLLKDPPLIFTVLIWVVLSLVILSIEQGFGGYF